MISHPAAPGRTRGGLCTLALLASGLGHAVAAPASAEPGAEPSVQRSSIEDEGARIDELRVRGQTQRVTVTPKVGFTQPYEIVQSRGGRDAGEGTGGASTSVGKRVWNVLAF